MTLIFITYTRVVKVLWRIDENIDWDERADTNDTKQRQLLQTQTSSNIQNSNSISDNINNNNQTSHDGNREEKKSSTFTFPRRFFSKKFKYSAESDTASDMSGFNNNKLGSSLKNNKKSSKGTATKASGNSAAKSKLKNQLHARRKAAKMLISVAVMFAIFYLPIHILNILR
jgi:hypothetical protein